MPSIKQFHFHNSTSMQYIQAGYSNRVTVAYMIIKHKKLMLDTMWFNEWLPPNQTIHVTLLEGTRKRMYDYTR